MTSLSLALSWLVFAVILGIAEAVTVDLVAIWFSFGAVVSMIFALFNASFALQVAVFFISSILAIIVTKPFCKKILKTKKVSTNADTTIGMVGTVTESINSEEDTGRVYVNGLYWKAASFDGFPIEKGSRVVVKSIKGVTVEVEAV